MSSGRTMSLPPDLERSLECSICKDKFKTPKVVGCGHIFCLVCLNNYFMEQQCNHPPCPLCRKPILVPENGAAGFRTENFYEELIGHIEREARGVGVGGDQCAVCSTALRQREGCRSADYAERVCDSCRRQPHVGGGSLAGRVKRCSSHPGEVVAIYCLQCDVALCCLCKETRHRRHETQDLKDAVRNLKKSVFETQAEILEYIDEVAESLKDIKKIRGEFKENIEATRTEITGQVQNLIDFLVRERDMFLSELDGRENSMEKRLSLEQEDAETKDVRAKSILELSENLLNYGSNADIAISNVGIKTSWSNLKTEPIRRFGQGFRVEAKFTMREGLHEIQGRELGTLKISQSLSPWSPRKHIPQAVESEGAVTSSEELQQRISSSRWSLFPQGRSEIFSHLVEPACHLETSKMCKLTGNLATAWLTSTSSHKKGKFTRQRTSSTNSVTAMIQLYDDSGNQQSEGVVDNLPLQTRIRVAIQDQETVVVAFHPGDQAQAVMENPKRKSTSRRSSSGDDGIYVVSLQNGQFNCGKLRSLNLHKDEHFEYDITHREDIVVKTISSPNIRILPPDSPMIEASIGHPSASTVYVKETLSHDVAVFREYKGTFLCERCSTKGELLDSFRFTVESALHTPFQLKTAAFDRSGNLIVHLSATRKDMVFLISPLDRRKEHLSKPAMLHKVDLMALLPHGRICLFDKSEGAFMTLRYLQ